MRKSRKALEQPAPMVAPFSKLQDHLTTVFTEWCAVNNIPCDCSAAEFLTRPIKFGILQPHHYKWLAAYCALWDATFNEEG